MVPSHAPIARLTASWQGQPFSWFEKGQGEALVLLHGGGGTGKAWTAQMDELSTDYRVIAPDLPGFGQSERISGIDTVDGLGSVLLQWMTVLGIDRFVVGGNSMGGRVAMTAASLDPARARALVILDSVGLSLPNVPIVNPLTLPAAEFMSGLVHNPDAYRRKTPYRTLQDAQELNQGRRSFAAYLRSSPIGPGAQLNLAKLTMPALLIWGRQDQIVPLAYGRALSEALPAAELLVIDACGHLPHIEEPAVVNHAMRDFFWRNNL